MFPQPNDSSNNMNSTRKTSRAIETDLRSVLHTIGSNSGHDLNQSTFETSQTGVSLVPVRPTPGDRDASDDVIALRINPDTNRGNESEHGNVLGSTVQSASQIQQLATRLEATEIELQQREADLEQRVHAWNQTTVEQQLELEKRFQQLEQQASQVRCQQMHLMQLQTDIVKSQNATREAIETLVLENGSDKESFAALTALKYELSGRFDYIARRWDHLAELMCNVRTKIDAGQAANASVDWTDPLP